MKKSLEMRNELESMKKDAQTLLDENKVKEAQDKMEEIKNMKTAIQIQEELEKEEEDSLIPKIEDNFGGVDTGLSQNKTKENATFIRAALKKVTGKTLTEAENALLLPNTTNTNGANGEGYILPEDVRTLITKKLREYKSIRSVIGYYPAGALTGSFPVENFETVTGLVDFTDGTDGEESSDIKFTNIKYALKEKAAFIKLSNTLLALTDNALIAYIVDVFAKKAMVTENKMAFDTMKKGKTAKAINGWKGLKKSLNVDIDPAATIGTIIVTNQDGWDYLDEQVDSTGRPMLQPNPSNPTQKLFKGYVVEQFSNALLPSESGKAPIFYGNLSEAIKMVDLSGLIQFATSSEAGFMSNTTIARLIEFVDVIQTDSSDKCYCYGELTLTTKEVK